MRRRVLLTTMALLIGMACWIGGSRGSGPSERGLVLELDVPAGDREVGEPVAFDVVLKNVGEDSLRVFHPTGPPYSGWFEWKLGLYVEDPSGTEWEAVPSWKYSLVRFPRLDQFQWLGPGAEIRMPFDIKPLSEAQWYAETTITGGGEDWFVSVPLAVDPWSVDRDSLREATGITRFGTYSVSGGPDPGGEDYLLVISVLEAVFRNPGIYRIRVDYENHTTAGIEDGDGGRTRGVEVDGCWVGGLSATAEIELRPAGTK